jgi:hypothetical protein
MCYPARMNRRAAALVLVLITLLAPGTTSAQILPDSLVLAPRPMAPLLGLSAFWSTRAERSGYRLTSTYDETVEYLRRIESASSLIRVQSFGRSGQGRDLLLVVAAKDRAFTPEAARASGKPVVLIQCGLHSGEIEGKAASRTCSTTASC